MSRFLYTLPGMGYTQPTDPTMPENLLQIDGLTKSFKGLRATSEDSP